MIDNKKNIKIVVENLKKHGIKHMVISPGGTNIALIKEVQDDPFFQCYSVVDERSAMYIAVGIYLRTGESVATCCTSAQATRNYIPGLTEAFYKKAPILAITMSKHPRFNYQEYMQAPDQCSLPDDCVKKSYCLPVISEKDDILHSIRLTNEAMLELTHHGKGPVQLCIPWLDFPLQEFNPVNRNIVRYEPEEDWNVDISEKRILIAIGEHLPFLPEVKNAIERFCDSCNCAVYVNHLSNYSGKYSFLGNLLLSTVSLKDLKKTVQPDILITIGGQTGDYPFYKAFSRTDLTGMEHWRVDQSGDVVDTYDKLTKIFACTDFTFFNRMARAASSEHSYFSAIQTMMQFNRNVDIPLSNTYTARALTEKIPQGSVVQFSILNSLRTWDLFEFQNKVECFCNVAAFGIDGGMSTLLGQSMVTDAMCFMVIGDLAFLYDMNCLSIRGLRNNIRILLINNNGGVEFKLGGGDNANTDRYIAAGNHFKNAKGWAETCGFDYLNARTKAEFDHSLPAFVSANPRPMLFEVFMNDYEDADAYNKIIAANHVETTADSLKASVKKILSLSK